MSIFHKVALQSLKKSRTRTFVTMIGVVLSAALFTGVITFAISLQQYMINGAAAKCGSWHVEIPDADPFFEAAVAGDGRVADSVTLQNIGYAVLEDSKNEYKPYLFLSGWDQKAFDTLPLKLLSGRLPENSSEVLIPAHLASNGGVRIAVGDTITLETGDRVSGDRRLSQHDAYTAGAETFVPVQERSYTVVGLCQRPAIEEYSAPGYTLITAADTAEDTAANTAADVAAGSSSVFITLKNPYQLRSYLKELGADTGYVLNNDVLRFMGLSGERVVTVLLYSISVILILLVGVGSVFLIYNAFHISMNERMHQFGILMSVGATARQLQGSVLFEGLCIGAAGVPIGILVGLPGIRLVLSLVEKNFSNVMYDNVPLQLVISWPAILAVVVVSFVTILISAYIPAKKASDTPVMECIRQTNEIKAEAKKLKIPRFMRRFLSLEQRLALKNFRRNKRPYRSIVLSLTFSVVLFVSASSFGAYLNQIAEDSGQVTEQYDIVFSGTGMEEAQFFQLYDQLKNTSGVTAAAYQADVTYPCRISAGELSGHFLDTFGAFIEYQEGEQTAEALLDAVFVDDATYQGLLGKLGLSEKEYDGQDNGMIMAACVEDYLYMQDEPMEFSLCDKQGDTVMTVRAAYVEDFPDLLPKEADDGAFRGYSLMLIAPYGAKARFDALGTATASKQGMTFESDNPGRTAAQMQTSIDANGITADYTLYNVYEILEDNRNLSFIVNFFAAVFIVMITLISIANVFNTISTNIKLRKRELAMIRSIGMSDRDFNRMMRFECILYGARTMLWGLPLSALLSCLIYRVIMLDGGFDIVFIFPWKSMGVSILGVFLIVFITMLYATSQIKKENIIDAIRDELA